MPKKLRKNKHCLNCGRIINDFNYCPDCGQLNTTKQVPLRHFFHDFLGDYFTFDSKFFRSFIPLIKKPGHLTNEYNQGKRVSYIFPLRLYIFTTVLFFFIITLNSQFGRADMEAGGSVVSKDSLSALVANYGDQIPSNTKKSLVNDIFSRYKLSARPKAQFSDSLYALLENQNIQLPDTTKMNLVDDLTHRLKLSEKGTFSNQGFEIKYLKKILREYPELEAQNGVDELAELIDSRFRVQPNYGYSPENPDGKITLKIGNTEADSLEEGFKKRLALKAKSLFEMERGSQIFWQEVLNQIPKAMFLILPIFALIIKLLYIRHKIYYINHLVFSLHVHTVIFLYLIVAILFPRWYVITPVIIAIWLHLFMAFRNVYKQSFIKTFFKLNSLLFLYFFPLVFGFLLLVVLAVVSV